MWGLPSLQLVQAHTATALQAKVKPARLRIGQNAALVINARDVTIDSLVLEGSLLIDAIPEASLRIDGLHVQNKSWNLRVLNPDKPMKEEWAIRQEHGSS